MHRPAHKPVRSGAVRREDECKQGIRIKIYCYIAIAGLLWSNWCEYKRNLGVDFGEYSLKQYRYAKEYSRLAKKECIDRNLL